MFIEILRRRRLRHIVATRLNLLTHALPKLFPSKVTSSSHGDNSVRLVSGPSQLIGGSDKASRRRLISQQRLRRRMLQTTRCGHISERSGNSDDLPTEEAVKQPPPSIESLQDSGVAFSESSIHSVPSMDTPATASVSSPAEDMVTGGGNSRNASPSTTPTTLRSCSFPIVGFVPLGAASSVDPSDVYPSLPTPSSWTITKTNGTPQHPSIVKGKSLNHSDQDIYSSVPPADCCIPP